MTLGEIIIALLLGYLCFAQYWTNRLLRAQAEVQAQTLIEMRRAINRER